MKEWRKKRRDIYNPVVHVDSKGRKTRSISNRRERNIAQAYKKMLDRRKANNNTQIRQNDTGLTRPGNYMASQSGFKSPNDFRSNPSSVPNHSNPYNNRSNPSSVPNHSNPYNNRSNPSSVPNHSNPYFNPYNNFTLGYK